MQLVSAAKWKRFNDRLNHFLYFWSNYKDIVEHLASYTKFSSEVSRFFEPKDKGELVVVLSSEKGLCGSYNSNIIKFFSRYINNKSNFQVFPIGKKVLEYCSRNNLPIKYTESQFLGDVNFQKLSKVFERILNAYLVDDMKITIIYTYFVNTMVYKVVIDTFLPLSIEHREVDEKLWIYEPKPREILDEVFNQFLLYRFLYYFYESLTSEHASRMVAMKNATENASDLILDLTIVYNKARQAAITKELLDIVGTAEALR